MVKKYSIIDKDPNIKDVESKAEFNIFRFQDHLLSWLYSSSEKFSERNIVSAWEDLTMVYVDVKGFFNEEERKKIKKLWDDGDGVIRQLENDMNNSKKKRLNFYNARMKYIYFRSELLDTMTRHNLTIRIRRDTRVGAGSS